MGTGLGDVTYYEWDYSTNQPDNTPAYPQSNYQARFVGEVLMPSFEWIGVVHRETSLRELAKQKNAYSAVQHMMSVAIEGMYGEPLVDITVESWMGVLVHYHCAMIHDPPPYSSLYLGVWTPISPRSWTPLCLLALTP